MSYLLCTHCGEAMDIFGAGGGETVATALTQLTGVEVPLLGQIPLDVRLREAGDSGDPLVLADPSAPASIQLVKVADSRRQLSPGGAPVPPSKAAGWLRPFRWPRCRRAALPRRAGWADCRWRW